MRLPRIRVRTLMVLVLLVGCGLGWVMHRARVQRDAVEAIKRAGGTVYYGWEPGKSFSDQTFDTEPFLDWLPISPEFFDSIAGVQFEGPQPPDSVLPQVARLPWVQSLEISADLVGDKDLVHLEGMTRLQSLALDGTGITDAGLKHLTGLTRLKWLTLLQTRVTPDGIKALQGALPLVEILGPDGRVYPRASDGAMGTPAK